MTRLCEKVVPAASVIPLKSSLFIPFSRWSKRALCFQFFFKPPQHKNFVLLMEQEKEYITADRAHLHGVK